MSWGVPPRRIHIPPDSDSSQATLRTSCSGDGVKDKVHHTAENYIAPERLDQAEHFVEGVGSKAAQYVPAGVSSVVSSYWCEWKSSRSRSGTMSVSSCLLRQVQKQWKVMCQARPQARWTDRRKLTRCGLGRVVDCWYSVADLGGEHSFPYSFPFIHSWP